MEEIEMKDEHCADVDTPTTLRHYLNWCKVSGDCKRHFSTSEISVKNEIANVYNFRLCLSLPQTTLQIHITAHGKQSQITILLNSHTTQHFPVKVDVALPPEH
jgi:hypothetical protein